MVWSATSSVVKWCGVRIANLEKCAASGKQWRVRTKMDSAGVEKGERNESIGNCINHRIFCASYLL